MEMKGLFFDRACLGILPRAHKRARHGAGWGGKADRPILEPLEPRMLLSAGPVVVGDVFGADASCLRFTQTDPSGGTQQVTVYMTGGAADVAWDSDVEWNVANGIADVITFGARMMAINLHDTVAGSSLAVTVSDADLQGAPVDPFDPADSFTPPMRTSVGTITGTGVDKILAPQVNLVGTGIDLTEAVSYCTLGDVAASASLVFGGTVMDTLTFTAGQVASPELTFPGTVERLRVKNWTSPADITAAAFIRVESREGDFVGNLVATNGDIGSVRIRGVLAGDVTAENGSIGIVQAWGYSSWQECNFSSSYITAAGQVGIIDMVGGELEGVIQADSIGLISTSHGFFGTIEAETSIGSIRGGLVGTAQAGTSIGSFFGNLSGTLNAGDSIGGIWLDGGGSASLTAQNSIGTILIAPRVVGVNSMVFTVPGPGEGSIGTYTMYLYMYDTAPCVLTINFGPGSPPNPSATLGPIHAVGVDVVLRGTVPFDPSSIIPQVISEEFSYTSDYEMSEAGYAVPVQSAIGGNVYFELIQAV